MEIGPKSFWGATPELDPAKLWVSPLDDLGLRTEADLIRIAAQAHIPLTYADEYELWELAAASGHYLIETMLDRDSRIINEQKKAEYEAEKEKRDAIIARQAERRRNRKAGR